MSLACPRAQHPRSPAAPRRLAAAVLGLLVLVTAGCIRYSADIRVAPDGKVLVREQVRVDQEWKAEVKDTLQAAGQVMDQYVLEARQRGGRVLSVTADSALVEFSYPSLQAFARAWPDSADEGQQWDRSLYRRRKADGQAVDELILWRMSPPDRTRERPNQRYPVLTFWVTPPAPPVHENSHFSRDGVYGWRFTEEMGVADSVWIVWPATTK